MIRLGRFLLAGLLLGVAACSQTGEALRALPTAEATARDEAASGLAFTPGELRLRREAHALKDGPTADAYAEALLGAGFESGEARYDKLMSDVAADGARIEALLASAESVLATDPGREGASEAALAERLEKALRTNENRRLVRNSRIRLVARLDVYRQALGQLVLAEPGRQAIAVEEAITELEWRLRRLQAV